MKRYLFILTVSIVALALLAQIGCREQAGTVATNGVKPAPGAEKKGPRITFEKVVHDFGDVGPETAHSCDFRFTNTGDDVLKLEQPEPESACPCIVAELSKTEYAPGESGVIRITSFEVPEYKGTARERFTVQSNDKTRPTVTLTVQAEVVPKIDFAPKRLRVLLGYEGGDGPEITLTSVDGQLFAIKDFKTTSSGITADYDPSFEAKKHIIRPKINIKGLRKRIRGSIHIELTHPGCKGVTIPFTVVPTFQFDPPRILLFNAEAGKPIRKVLWLANNLGEDFEVESVSSEKGLISVLSREKVENLYKFELEITPPADTGKKRFADVFHINIKGGPKLSVPCNGFYPKKQKESAS